MDDGVRVWLVERSYSDKGLVTLVYATPDGDRHVRMQRSSNMLRNSAVTAGMAVDPDRLSPVTDEAERERFAAEAGRMRERHDPADAV
jgi:hypothetical protein